MTAIDFRYRNLLFGIAVSLLLLLNACASTVDSPALPSPDLDWQSRPEIPSDLRASLKDSQLLSVEGEGGVTIPIRGFGTDGSRTPLLMVHGLQSHSGWFAQSAAYVASLGHPVYVIDRRGSGLSQAKRGDIKDFMEWSAEIRIVADWAKARHRYVKVFLLGHCFGAIPATVYAQESPEGIKGLILSTPGIYTHTSIPFSQMMSIALSSSGNRNDYFPVPLEPDQFSELAEYEPFVKADPLALRAVTGDLYWQVHKARKSIKVHTGRLTMPVMVGFAGEDEIADNQKTREWLIDVPAPLKTEAVYSDARHILEYSLERNRYFKDLGLWLERIEARQPWR